MAGLQPQFLNSLCRSLALIPEALVFCPELMSCLRAEERIRRADVGFY
jgi:hypothetical protein